MVCFIWNIQDSFISNLLRLIHTMKPPKKKKKATKKTSTPSDATSQPSNPAVEERKKRFPGLSQPDDPNRAMTLMQPSELEVDLSKDHDVASAALSEVRA